MTGLHAGTSLFGKLDRFADVPVEEQAADQCAVAVAGGGHLRLPSMEQGQRILDLLGLKQGIDHASECEVTRNDAAAVDHLFPESPATVGPLQGCTSLDEQTICPHARTHLSARVCVDCPRKVLAISVVDARIQNGVQDNLVVKHERIRAVQYAESPVSVACIRKMPCQSHHGRHHAGVQTQLPAVHLRDNPECLLAVQLLGSPTQEATK
mmetsp:Transcript_57868/g.146784  ORF Transcript_57868/g.146784 Transcript_57868/m.146784 type:complete len:210 (+) Transcript_57868:157-786(+)